MEFQCTECGEIHQGVPSLATDAPLYYYGIPEQERGTRCVLTADTCVVDEQFFFVRGCIEIPVLESHDPFVWGLWVSLSGLHFETFLQAFDADLRSHIGPFFGWLSASVSGYPETENLKTMVHLRDHGLRPLIELEPTDHPLAVEQREGVSRARLGEILSFHFHS